MYVISSWNQTLREHDDVFCGIWCVCVLALNVTAKECIDNQLGVDYDGTVSTTDTGRTCQYWSETYPHSHHLTEELGDQHNYCRNADNEPFGPWCYTTDAATRWEYCTVPHCDSFDDSPKPEQNCRMDQQGRNYTGTISKTRLGNTCQPWSSLTPYQHRFSVKMKDHENYCRNPDNEEYGPWCYTTDPDVRWEFCDIPYCEGADNPGKAHWKRGWQRYDDSCYSIQYIERNWDDAKDFCKYNLNAYLAEIQTAGENNFLMSILPKPTLDDNDIEVWLGANDLKRIDDLSGTKVAPSLILLTGDQESRTENTRNVYPLIYTEMANFIGTIGHVIGGTSLSVRKVLDVQGAENRIL